MSKAPDNSAEIAQWLRLINAEGVGAVTFARLLKAFGSVERAMGTSIKDLCGVEGIGLNTAERIFRSRNSFDAEKEIELAEKNGVWIIHLNDERYPAVLKKTYDPPPVIYIKGTLSKADNLSLAIVGSRRCSIYGQEQASRFAHLLASAGFTICSGMARGIDTAAHQGALSAGGRTIAVQGCGLLDIYPPENKKLFEQITESGACISELPLKSEPRAENFSYRNRIIAGLSLGTIVVEAGFNSGALITAQAALENDREVMAVPGRIDSPLSRGANQLIKQGAKLVESVSDITEALGYVGEQVKEQVVSAAKIASDKMDAPLFDIVQLKLNTNEKMIYECLNKEPMHIEQIIEDTGLQAGSINSALISLQLKGVIKNLPGNFFLRR